MTLHRTHGEIEFHCDSKACHEVYETGTRDFGEALNDFRDSDWQTRKVGSVFLHICPDCIEAERPAL